MVCPPLFCFRNTDQNTPRMITAIHKYWFKEKPENVRVKLVHLEKTQPLFVVVVFVAVCQ